MREHLTEAVQEYVRRTRLRLHVPAHGGGRGNPALDRLWPGLQAWDVTEQPELDDLSHPEGALLFAQRDAASMFGAAAAYFLTGGATLGVQAAVLGAIGDGGTLLLARDSHRSVLGALVVADGEAVLADPERDAKFGVSLGMGPGSVRHAFAQHPDIRAVLVTYPSYLGIAPPLREVAEIAHGHGAIVIADSAHGAHFGLHEDLPRAALDEGADLVVLGMHKTGGALTQTAMLLARDGPGRDALPGVEVALRLLQSSSPSYLLLVSIEQALGEMARGAPGLGHAIEQAQTVRGPTRIETGLPQDPLRVGLRCRDADEAGDLSGRLEAIGVRGEYREEAEVLFVIPWGERDLSPLRLEVERLSAPGPVAKRDPLPLTRVRPRRAILGPRRWVPLSEADGRVAADVVGIVPPGIPALWPGEHIQPGLSMYLAASGRAGHRVLGIENDGVWVVAE